MTYIYKLPIKRLRKNLKAKLPKEVEELYPSSLPAMFKQKCTTKNQVFITQTPYPTQNLRESSLIKKTHLRYKKIQIKNCQRIKLKSNALNLIL
jgi:hypothetical protein